MWKKRLNKGFTLIEILVVMVIILIITTIAVLAIGDAGRSRRVKYSAQSLIGLFNYAETYAVLTPATLRFEVNGTSYGFQQLMITEKNNKLTAQWETPKNELLREQTFSSSIDANLSKVVVFNPNGTLTPMRLALNVKREKKYYLITGNAAGNFKLSLEHTS